MKPYSAITKLRLAVGVCSQLLPCMFPDGGAGLPWIPMSAQLLAACPTVLLYPVAFQSSSAGLSRDVQFYGRLDTVEPPFLLLL